MIRVGDAGLWALVFVLGHIAWTIYLLRDHESFPT